ncbi:uncharacterized protein [Leptinotarsa decemlineata]|uniref:uncharacterized protein n=1 Tax=Leptinotarsa decemlineata TaxID=7539 RepID=UPI003D30D3CE
MNSLCILFLLFGTALCENAPVYKYRYETEDVMKTAASNVPVHGYHVVEGGYYPSHIGLGGIGNQGFGGAGFIAGGGGYGGQYLGAKLAPIGTIGLEAPLGGQYIGKNIAPLGVVPVGYGGINGPINGGLGPFGGQGIGYAGAGLIGAGAGYGGAGIGLVGPQGYGGEAIEKENFSGGKKNFNDESYEKSQGKKGEEVNYGDSGYSNGQVAVKDVKGDSGYYNNADGEKKVYEDGKQYAGGQHFNKEGKNGEEKTVKQGHKKGHKIKSFKTSHHKDENGKTEEYYDEAHDEGGNYVFNGQTGNFGENGASSFKGGNQEEKYASGENKKEGHYSNEHLVDKVDASQGKYGGNKFAGNEAVYSHKNGADEQSLLGHQESSKLYKHNPFVVPFHRY